MRFLFSHHNECHGTRCAACSQVLQAMSTEQREGLTALKLRYKARDFALKTVASQREQFKRCVSGI